MYLDIAKELEKNYEHESDSSATCNCNCAWYCHQRIDNNTGGLGNKRTSRDHPNERIKTGKNTEESPRDLLSLKFKWKTIS